MQGEQPPWQMSARAATGAVLSQLALAGQQAGHMVCNGQARSQARTFNAKQIDESRNPMCLNALYKEVCTRSSRSCDLQACAASAHHTAARRCGGDLVDKFCKRKII